MNRPTPSRNPWACAAGLALWVGCAPSPPPESGGDPWVELAADRERVTLPIYAASFAPGALPSAETNGIASDTLGPESWTPVVQPPQALKIPGMRAWHFARLAYPDRGDVDLRIDGQSVAPAPQRFGSNAWVHIKDDHFHPDGIYLGSTRRFVNPGEESSMVAEYTPDRALLSLRELGTGGSDAVDFAIRDITIGDETRPGFYVPGRSRVEVSDQWIARGAELIVGAGVLPHGPPGRGVEFRVGFREDGGEEIGLFDQPVMPSKSPSWLTGGPPRTPWQEFRIPLDSVGDRRGTIVLETRVLDGPGDPGKVRAAWGHPIIRRPSAVPEPWDNLVIVNFDTLRRDHLGCYGYGRNTSPVIDSLATVGIRFDRAIHASSWTRPSVAALFASDHPRDLGILSEDHRHRLGADPATLAEVFAQAGWLTTAIVSNAHLKPAFGLHRGFHQHVYAMERADELSDRAIRWLERHGDLPFVLYLHYIDPHSPYRPHEGFEFMPEYEGRVYDDPQEVYRRSGIRPGTTTGRKRGADSEAKPEEVTVLTAAELDKMRALYDGEIAFADRHFGRVLATLRDLQLADGTLVLVTADHGEEFRDHGGYYHGYTLYEEQVGAPLVLVRPGMPPGTVNDIIPMIDIAPSLANLFGLTPPAQWEGADFSPLLDSATPSETPRRAAVSETHFRGARSIAYESGDQKVIFDSARDTWEFFSVDSRGRQSPATDSTPFAATVAGLRKWMADHPWAEGAAPDTAASPDAQTIQALRTLGYLD